MSSWIYKKPEPPTERGICVVCDTYPQKKTSRGSYQSLCSGCDSRRFPTKLKYKYIKKYRKYKKDVCEECGFVPKHSRQMDVHHIDGNHHNNDPNNLKTLCANCHRLEHTETPET